MSDTNTNAFFAGPDEYDLYMGRYAAPLAKQFVQLVSLSHGDHVLDLGSGPGALTTELVRLVGAESVSAVDPSPPFLEACEKRHPGITAKRGRAEEIPFADNSFDAVLSQLVLHFIGDLTQAGSEIARVTRSGGQIATCTWIVDQMGLFATFDQAAVAAGTSPQATVRVKRFEEDGSIASWFETFGLIEIEESTITVNSTYDDFDSLWESHLAGVGPMAPWLKQQPENVKSAIRAELFTILGEPTSSFHLTAIARAGRGIMPG